MRFGAGWCDDVFGRASSRRLSQFGESEAAGDETT
jgi:hypothetical protein